MQTGSQDAEPRTWTYTADLVLTGRRAQVEVILADLQRKCGDDLEVVKGPFQHRGSWGSAAGLPRGFPRWPPVDHRGFRGGNGGGPRGQALTSAGAGRWYWNTLCQWAVWYNWFEPKARDVTCLA
jgi:hypothetical protein